MYERYTTATAVSADTHNIPPHDAVLLAGTTAGGLTELIMFAEGTPRGKNGRVMNPNLDGSYGGTGPLVVFHGAANGDHQILPMQVKGSGNLGGHNVYLLSR